jgi:putative hydrolase of the HAD superfamily
MLKAVTFDLWGTLIKERPTGIGLVKAERIRQIEEALAEEQIIRDGETIARAYDSMGDQLTQLWKEHRDIGAREQVERLLDILAIGDHISRSDSMMERLVEAYTLPILSELPLLIDGVSDVLAALAARDFRMAVICNTGRTPGKVLRIILQRLEVGHHFSVQTFSDELGLRKPHPEIFRRTLSGLDVEPPKALHIGDTLAADIAGARGVGMHAVHFCHRLGADPNPSQTETIFSYAEFLPIIDRIAAARQ